MKLDEIGNGGFSSLSAFQQYFYARTEYIISDQTGGAGISLVLIVPAAGPWLGSGTSLFLMSTLLLFRIAAEFQRGIFALGEELFNEEASSTKKFIFFIPKNVPSLSWVL